MGLKISVIIPTYRREQLLINTITSVLNEINRSGLQEVSELLVVDQTEEHSCEVKRQLENLLQYSPLFHLVYTDIPNLPRARNIGIRQAKGDIIVFLDDDVELLPDFFNACLDAYKNHMCDAVTGKVILKNKGSNILLSEQSSFKKKMKRFLMSFWGNKAFIISSGGLVLSNTISDTEMKVDGGQGCNMTFKRSVFQRIGYFDENYIGNALREETDIFVRMQRQGLSVWYTPSMALNHIMENVGGTRSEQGLTYWEKYFFNQCYFYQKNFKFGLGRIRIMIAFDYLKCRRKFDVGKLLKDSFEKACREINV
jgi:GT2 family glycosyltransferase